MADGNESNRPWQVTLKLEDGRCVGECFHSPGVSERGERKAKSPKLRQTRAGPPGESRPQRSGRDWPEAGGVQTETNRRGKRRRRGLR